MIEDLKKVINEKLPSLAAGELKSFIEQAQADKEKVDSYLSKNKALEKDNKELLANEQSVNRMKVDLASELERLTELGNDLIEKERNLKVTELEQKLAARNEILTNNKEFMLMLVKNPRAIEYMNNDTYGRQTYQDNQGYPITAPIDKHESGTKEVIESKDD